MDYEDVYADNQNQATIEGHQGHNQHAYDQMIDNEHEYGERTP